MIDLTRSETCTGLRGVYAGWSLEITLFGFLVRFSGERKK